MPIVPPISDMEIGAKSGWTRQQWRGKLTLGFLVRFLLKILLSFSSKGF
jgi:hypothetical protein